MPDPPSPDPALRADDAARRRDGLARGRSDISTAAADAMDQVFAHAESPIATVSPDGIVLAASPTFAAEFGRVVDEVVGSPWLDLFGADRDAIAALVAEHQDAERFWSAEVPWTTPGGRAVRLQAALAVTRDADGRRRLHLRLIDADPVGTPEPGAGQLPDLADGPLFGRLHLDAALVVADADAGARVLLGATRGGGPHGSTAAGAWPLGTRWLDVVCPTDTAVAAEAIASGNPRWAAVLRVAGDPPPPGVAGADPAAPDRAAGARWVQVQGVAVDGGWQVDLAAADHWIRLRDDLVDAELRARSLLDEIPVALVELSTDGRVVTANPALSDLVGGDARGRWVAELIPPDDLLRVFEAVAVALAEDRVFRTEFRVVHPGGEQRWVRGAGRSLVDDEGTWRSLIGAWIDITDEVAVRQASERFADLLENIDDLVGITDGSAAFVHLNRAGRELLGAEPGEVVHSERLIARVVTDDPDGLVAEITESIVSSGSWSGEARLDTAHGVRDVSVLILAHTSDLDGARYSIVLTRDITPLKAAERVLRERATHDLLTGLGNRSLLLEALDEQVERRRASPGGLALLFVDLDHFKPVNDTHGHAAGDLVLAATAARLREAVRDADLVARFGGDEFVVLCPDVDDVAEASAIAERIVADLARPLALPDGTPVHIGASVGIAALAPGDDPQGLLRRADAALGEAKSSGRGRVVVAPAP